MSATINDLIPRISPLLIFFDFLIDINFPEIEEIKGIKLPLIILILFVVGCQFHLIFSGKAQQVKSYEFWKTYIAWGFRVMVVNAGTIKKIATLLPDVLNLIKI